MEFIAGILLFMVGWYWVILGAAILAVYAFLEGKNDSTAFFIVSFVAFLSYHRFDLSLALFVDNTAYVIAMLLVYIAIGVGVSFLKWFYFITERVTEYLKLRRAFLGSEDDSIEIPDNLLVRWFDMCYNDLDHCPRISEDNPMAIIPKVSKMSSQITSWIGFWPFYLVGLIIEDFVQKLIERTVEALRGLYQSIANRAFTKMINDAQRFSDKSRREKILKEATNAAERS